MTTKRIGPGMYIITDANGTEWETSRHHDLDNDGNERPSTYWMATDRRGGYVEAQTLREIKEILGRAA